MAQNWSMVVTWRSRALLVYLYAASCEFALPLRPVGTIYNIYLITYE